MIKEKIKWVLPYIFCLIRFPAILALDAGVFALGFTKWFVIPQWQNPAGFMAVYALFCMAFYDYFIVLSPGGINE